MISIKVDSTAVMKYLDTAQKEVMRAAETALDKTAVDIRDALVEEMKSVFDRPTNFTLNSLKVTKTRNHNMQAIVGFKKPDRMADHYLLPQVEGGVRKLKGFEQGIDDKQFVPGKGLKLNASGNITFNQARTILNELKKPGTSTDHNYIYLPYGSRNNKLPPGVYQRFANRGTGLGATTKKSLGAAGIHQKGMRRGRISSIIRARGLRPILLLGKQNSQVKPLLKFEEIAVQTANKVFEPHFLSELARRLPR